jgi:histidinol-phosphatase (PHP family)
VHWLGTWQFDDLGNPIQMAEWHARGVERAWEQYTRALEELAATKSVDVLAHPDLVKVAGFVPANASDYWDQMAEAASSANVSMELSSAGWRKPINEQYPAEGFLDRLVARGVTFTTASDAHRHERVAERSNDLASLLEARGVHELASYDQRQRSMVPLRSH